MKFAANAAGKVDLVRHVIVVARGRKLRRKQQYGGGDAGQLVLSRLLSFFHCSNGSIVVRA
jgi:hypothetical protein